MPYQSNVAGALARLLSEQGQLRGQRSADTGRIWGGAISNIGNRVASGFADAQQRREEAPRRALQEQEIQARMAALKDNEQAKAEAQKVQRVSAWLTDLAGQPDPTSSYQQGRAALIADGTFSPQDAPEFFPGKSWVKARMTQLLPAAERFKQLFPEDPKLIERDPVKDLANPLTGEVVTPGTPKPPEPYTLGPGQQRRGGDNALIAEVPTAAPKVSAPSVGSFEDYITRTYGDAPTPAQIIAGRKAYLQSDDRPRITVNGADPKTVAVFNQIAGAYDRSPLVKAADRTIVLDDAIKAIRANPSNPASQMTLAYSWVQALDTYQSAVREGELQNLGLLGTKVQQLRTSVNKVINEGAFMPPEVAKQVADSAAELVKTINAGRTRKMREFASRAKVSGVGEMWDQFVGGFTAAPTGNAPQAPAGWKYVPKPGGGWTAVEDR